MITLVKKKVVIGQDRRRGYRLAVKNHGTVKLEDTISMLGLKNTVTRTDVLAVISALYELASQHLKNGYSVSLGDLGTLQMRISGEGTETASDWKAGCVKKTHVAFVPSVKMKQDIAMGAQGINLRVA